MQLISTTITSAAKTLNTTPEVVTQWLWDDFFRPTAEEVGTYADEAVQAADDAALKGRINRHELYTPSQADNARYDCGFWGGHPVERSHCGAKSKRTMLRKRGRV